MQQQLQRLSTTPLRAAPLASPGHCCCCCCREWGIAPAPAAVATTRAASSSSHRRPAGTPFAPSPPAWLAAAATPAASDFQHHPQHQQPLSSSSKRRRSKLSRRQQQQQEQQEQQGPWQQLQQADAAADDLDALAAAAAATTGASSTSTTASSSVLNAAAAMPPAMITSIPDAAPAYPLPAGRVPRYRAADKLQLSGEAARDIARRLRRPRSSSTSNSGSSGRGGRVLRVFKYGIDDLRLYKAVDVAGLEGRLLVVDSMDGAEAVLTTRQKRTGRNVNLATARRAADGAGVPLLVLSAVSPQRLLEAVGPLLGLQPAAAAAAAPAPAGRRGRDEEGGPSHQPRMLRWEEVEADGSEELLQLMWGGHAADADQGAAAPGLQAPLPAAAAAAAAGMQQGACAPTPRWHAWRAAQAGSPSGSAALFAELRAVDVEDARDGLVPANPTARAGERHRLPKPMRPFSRVRRRQLRRELAERAAPW